VSATFTQTVKKEIFRLHEGNFAETALAVFRYQARHSEVYRRYLHYLGVSPDSVRELRKIPFLPIDFFKNHEVRSTTGSACAVFESSGTTGQQRSRHFVSDLPFYRRVSEYIFEQTYGPLRNCHLLALLPSYLERSNSSLVYMVDHFIQRSGSGASGFYLNNTAELVATLRALKGSAGPVVLLGVTFALLDLAEAYPDLDLSGVIVMETGGMKGRREEITREELHEILMRAFNVPAIHAEYGMTELLSQAYATGNGLFTPPPWMKILIRDVNDPFHLDNQLRSGGINIIDLANIDSCAFIETQDIGQVPDGNNFRVFGRLDNSDIRGCNLLVAG
jgi:phenylacetate-coenzyme A ligase PaaK-like adenylate-forming protein